MGNWDEMLKRNLHLTSTVRLWGPTWNMSHVIYTCSPSYFQQGLYTFFVLWVPSVHLLLLMSPGAPSTLESSYPFSLTHQLCWSSYEFPCLPSRFVPISFHFFLVDGYLLCQAHRTNNIHFHCLVCLSFDWATQLFCENSYMYLLLDSPSSEGLLVSGLVTPSAMGLLVLGFLQGRVLFVLFCGFNVMLKTLDMTKKYI